MAYFPKILMPLTPKKNAEGSSRITGRSRITAEEYNLHDQEIRAIEEYLGVQASPSTAIPQTPSQNPETIPETQDIFAKVNALISSVNSFVDQVGGVNVSSGYCVSGRRIIFPEPSHATFLVRAPGARDTVIGVDSTLGFPDYGVISILNNVDVANLNRPRGNRWELISAPKTSVEWIKYGAKNGTQFLQCQRGYMGTTADTHHPPDAHTPVAEFFPENRRDLFGNLHVQPVLSDYTQTLVDADGRFADDNPAVGRHYPGWRQRYGYAMYAFSVNNTPSLATLLDIAWRFMRKAGTLRVPSNVEDSPAFVAAAGPLGLLGQRASDGTYFLRSQDAALRARGILSWAEAEAVTDALVLSGFIRQVATPTSWRWPASHIPVFRGRMHVNYAPANLGRSIDYRSSAMLLSQGADGTILARATEKTTKKLDEMVALAQFNCFLVGNPATTGGSF
jgi:hypothetical protein